MKDSISIKRYLPKKEPKGEIVSTLFVGSSFLGNSSKIKTVEHLVKETVRQTVAQFVKQTG